MIQTSSRRALAIAILGALAATGPARAQAPAGDRTAEVILAEIRAVGLQKRPNPGESSKDFSARQKVEYTRKAELIGELSKVAPDHEQLDELMPYRWAVLKLPDIRSAEADAEMAEVIAKGKSPTLVRGARYNQIYYDLYLYPRRDRREVDLEVLTRTVDDFVDHYPGDNRAALLLRALSVSTNDPAKKDAIDRRLEKDYPKSPVVQVRAENAARTAAAERRQQEGLGKPFEFTFVDAITGTEVSSKTLMGKVVVVDFWATWCVPCLEEMPKMKGLYAKYQDKGVEFVGISLDGPIADGGLDKLKDYVAKNGIGWPQFYQGKSWQGEFSSARGVNSIPRVFLVDAEGVLVSTDAGDRLDGLIRESLEKAKGRRAATKP